MTCNGYELLSFKGFYLSIKSDSKIRPVTVLTAVPKTLKLSRLGNDQDHSFFQTVTFYLFIVSSLM